MNLAVERRLGFIRPDIKYKHATKRHILTKRTTKNKRQLRPNAILPKCELAAVARMLPYA
ncbi:50S ribosomal protein L35 [Vibrio cholerae]|nr:50S ribosomal protein L35 [Vibrio cholerae]